MSDDQEKCSTSLDKESKTYVNKEASQNSTTGKKKLFRQTSKRAKLTEEQKWRSLAIIFIILDVLLLVITLTVVIVWVRDRGDQQLIPQASQFCLPREEISLHKDDDEENFKHFINKTENGKDVLCTKTIKHLDFLVNLYVERKFRIERANEPLYSYCDGYSDSSSKPVAKVDGVEYTYASGDNYNTHIISWDATSTLSFVQDVVYKNGQFAIIQKGYYYIYSQVTFKESNITENPYTSLLHSIFKIKTNGNSEYTEKLLESSQSKCQLQSQTSNSKSYIGDVFYLQENDNLQVRVTHPEKITKSPYSNFFGLHMI